MNRDQARAFQAELERRTTENVVACRTASPNEIANIRSLVEYIMKEEIKRKRAMKKGGLYLDRLLKPW